MARATVTYDDFKKRFIANPTEVMLEASEQEMNLAQFGNYVSPTTMVEQKRSITSRLMEEEGLFTRTSHFTKASKVTEFLEQPHKQALLYDILTRAYYGQRAISLEADAPVGDPTFPFEHSNIVPDVAVGNRFNVGEIVATSHEVGTDNYSPVKWDYEKENIERSKVNPSETIPAATLKPTSGTIQMGKWGNRFVLPYEALTGSSLRINKLADMIRLEGITEQNRLLEEFAQIVEKGDGTTGSAATILTNTNLGTAGTTFTFSNFVNFLDEMDPPFSITHVLLRKAELRSLRAAVSALSGGLAYDQLTKLGLAPDLENMEDMVAGVKYGRVSDSALTANYIAGIDARAAMEYVRRSGMAIREQANQIANQTQEVVISDTYLWAKLNLSASLIYNTGA